MEIIFPSRYAILRYMVYLTNNNNAVLMPIFMCAILAWFSRAQFSMSSVR